MRQVTAFPLERHLHQDSRIENWMFPIIHQFTLADFEKPVILISVRPICGIGAVGWDEQLRESANASEVCDSQRGSRI